MESKHFLEQSYPSSIDIPKEFFAKNEFITLGKLMLRWNNTPLIYIPKFILEGKLTIYFSFEKAFSNTRRQEGVLAATRQRVGHYPFVSKKFSYFIFKIEEVTSIEKDNTFLSIIPTYPQKNPMRICTNQNIEILAPKLVYILCKYTQSSSIGEIDTSEINRITYSGGIIPKWPDFYMPCDNFNELKMSKEEIWGEGNGNHPKNKENLTKYQIFIETHTQNGITDESTLAYLLDMNFPNEISHEDLGRLLKGKDSTIAPESLKKYGRRLRGLS